MRTRTLAVAGILGITASLTVAAPAVAADGSNCWGVVSAQAARSDGGLGAHSSSFDEPRLGLGNVARLFGVDIAPAVRPIHVSTRTTCRRAPPSPCRASAALVRLAPWHPSTTSRPLP
jgi:hypothetical protein